MKTIDCDNLIKYLREFEKRKEEQHCLESSDLPKSLHLGFVDHTESEHVTLRISRFKEAQKYLSQEYSDILSDLDRRAEYFKHHPEKKE